MDLYACFIKVKLAFEYTIYVNKTTKYESSINAYLFTKTNS